jgi:hypothetical protein
MGRFRQTLATSIGLVAVIATPGLTQEAAGQTSVNLLEEGAEPRREIRYRFDDNYSEALAMDMSVAMDIELGPGLSQQMQLPVIRLNMALDTVQVNGDGSARFDFETTSAEVVSTENADPAIAGAIGMALQQMPAISGWTEIDARGATLAGGLNFPEDVAGQLSQIFDSADQTLQQLSAPFPVEPVGVGARWQAMMDIESGGFSVSQTAEYRLTAMDADSVTLDISLTQTAGSQQIEAAGLPAGASANLESLESTGSGSMRINLNRLVPNVELSTSMTMVMAISMQGQSQQTGMSVDSDMTIMPASEAR